MDREARVKHITATRERLIQDHEAHVAQLYQLENEYGIDLDVFTDIYGLDVLDATEATSATVASWTVLYEALHSDADFVVIANPYKVPRGLLSSSHLRRETYRATQLVVIDAHTQPTLSLVKEAGDKPSTIEIPGAHTLILRTNSNTCGTQEWTEGDLLLAKPHSSEGFRIAATNTERWFASGVMHPSTGLGVSIVPLKRGDDFAEKFRSQDENIYFGIHRIQQELDRLVA